ncbi:hypothetical protein MRX96_033624 [Rhipicephalus microplus]
MKKCRVSPIRVVASRVSPTMEPRGVSAEELDLVAPCSAIVDSRAPVVGRPGLLFQESTSHCKEGTWERTPTTKATSEGSSIQIFRDSPTDGLSHRKVSLASSQPRSPPAKEPAAVKTVASPSTLSRRKRKRASIRKLLRSPSAAPSTPAVMSMNADATASVSVANRAAIEAGPATHQLARVRTPDHADTSTVPTKASAGLARHQGMEELQAIDQNRQRRTPLRETTNTLGHMSPGLCVGVPAAAHSVSELPRHPTFHGGRSEGWSPPVAASSSHATAQRKFRLTRTRSLPDLRQQAAAPEFLRNRLILQTDDTVYLPFILRKEYVIRTKLRVSFSLLKPPRGEEVAQRGPRHRGHLPAAVLQRLLGRDRHRDGGIHKRHSRMHSVDASDWRVDEGCNFFDLCYFRCKCCKKHAGPMAAVR